MKKSILTIGGSGLVGSRIVEILSDAYDFEDLSISTGLDITDKSNTLEKIDNSKAEIVILLAAKANVDLCEDDKVKDQEIALIKNDNEREESWKKEKTAWSINVLGVENVVKACKKFNKKLIYISTDFVFDGSKKSYTEDEKPNPINWYGKTKMEGEKVVINSRLDWIVARIAYPYRTSYPKNDFVRAILKKLQNNESVTAVEDQIIVPTFIDDIANALSVLIQKQEQGIFHVVGSQSITPYEAAIKIAREFNLNEALISKISRRDYFAKKALRPFCLNLKNDKITLQGAEMSSFDQGIKEIKKQMEKL